MICPTLSELPPPPPGKTGWPWTEGSPHNSGCSSAAPRISIVTPSLNQGQFLEETIRSVLLQGAPDLEYMVIDGGSTDESCEIIRKYSRWISHAVSEPDRGQAHAINKGIARMTGSIFGWINSDDLLLPGALRLIARTHMESPNHIIAGDVIIFQDGSSDEEFWPQKALEFRNFVEFWRPELTWAQPGIFIPSELMKRIGTIDESLHYLFDHDLLCRALPFAEIKLLHDTVARYRHHPASKTISAEDFFQLETVKVTRRYWSSLPELDLSAAKRHCVSLLIKTGLNRVIAGKPGSIFLKEALCIHPFWAAYSATGWAARRWLGYGKSKVVNKPLTEALPLEQPER